jgi:hypothetical protein
MVMNKVVVGVEEKVVLVKEDLNVLYTYTCLDHNNVTLDLSRREHAAVKPFLLTSTPPTSIPDLTAPRPS